LNRVALRPFVKGCISFVVPQLRNSHKEGGTAYPEYCYSIFLRHYTLLRRYLDKPGVPAVVAELGPGSSLGVGLAALLAGADRYVALDVMRHTAPEHDLLVLDELIELFRGRSPIPNSGRHASLFPEPAGVEMPDEIAMVLERTLNKIRLDHIRKAIVERRGIIDLAVPWTRVALEDFGKVDWILSHSVLEHVDDLEMTYDALGRWLRPEGLMTHLIDFDSHGLTTEWNGHWAVGERIWRILRGRRSYLINRASRSIHVEILLRNGFVLLQEIRERRSDGLLPAEFQEPFTRMHDEDARTRMAFFIAKLDHSSSDPRSTFGQLSQAADALQDQ
jgi:hypothetical protein